MAEPRNLTELDGSQSVSALGLRWAALRGMLASPLILSEEQHALREELLRELGNIEQNFVALRSRNALEMSAKIDIAKSALHEGLQSGQGWLISLLESIQTDLHAAGSKPASNGSGRAPVALSRAYQPRPEGNGAHRTEEAETAAAS